MKRQTRTRGLSCLCLGALILTLSACQTEQTTRGGEIGVDRRQTMTSLVSSSEVDQKATQEYAQILATARQKGLLNQNPQQLPRVRAIASRLVAQVGVFATTRRNGSGR